MKAGSIDIAPPSSTENMSSAIAPSMIWLPATKRAPSAMLRKIGPRCCGRAGSDTGIASRVAAASRATAVPTA